ncbi:hypothetical protein AZA_07874 [Nitrospirillum viridazoti Y2]|nr:hypothetical protein AZA_07874 [Nitrospirillum amazonense Y2]
MARPIHRWCDDAALISLPQPSLPSCDVPKNAMVEKFLTEGDATLYGVRPLGWAKRV